LFPKNVPKFFFQSLENSHFADEPADCANPKGRRIGQANRRARHRPRTSGKILREGVEGTPELVHALQDHVKKTTAPYKYPRIVEFVPELPKTHSGKIRRNALRDGK
jgi:acyl-CoA synthetase (AMP-forming)/AMP-acid ligase II